MRKILIFLLPVLFILNFINCGGEKTLATPNARITQILDQGGGLRFEWDPVEDADGYRVYVDGTQQYQGTNTYFEWTQAAMKIEIVAYAGDNESDPKTFDFTPVVTHVEVWDATDPDPNHPSYVKFVDGRAITVNASEKQSAWMLFVKDSVSTNKHNNSNVEAEFAPISGDIGSANIAPTAGNYQTRDAALEGSQYYIWFEFSPIDNQIGPNDYFAKMKIVGKTGSPAKYTVDFYFQKYAGLRWLKTQ